jgi:hypothetical protein
VVVCNNTTFGTAITGVTDNQANSYARAGVASDPNGGVTEIWYAKNARPGVTTIVVSWTGGGVAGCGFYDLSGTSSTAPLDAVASLNNQSSSAAPAGPAITPIGAGDVVVSAIATAHDTISVAGGFSLDALTFGDGFAHELNASTAIQKPAWTSAAGTWCGVSAAFR